MNPLNRPLKIIFCLPGTTFTHNFLMSWSNILTYCLNNKIIPIISQKTNSNVYFVRNACLGGNIMAGVNQKPFGGRIDYDFIMWIDSDQVFTVEQFAKLLAHNKNIVSGLYLMKGGDNYATVKHWDENFFKKNGYFRFLSKNDIESIVKKSTDLFTVDYTGFGWMLIKKGVIEKMQYPWFHAKEFTTTVNGVQVKEMLSEDLSFCHAVKDLGFKIYIDPTIIVGHEKMQIL